ncbi:hypothetical protein ACCS93_07825, partial [Rhizobium ruizarguesonis]
IPSPTTATPESHPDCRADLIQIVALHHARSLISKARWAFANGMIGTIERARDVHGALLPGLRKDLELEAGVTPLANFA